MYVKVGVAATTNAVVVATVLPNTGAESNAIVIIALSVVAGLVTWAIAYKLFVK